MIGGSPGLIAGAAGVIALPLSKLYATYGPSNVALALLLSSVLEIGFGVSRLGKIVDLVKPSVVAGFMNAFAIFLVTSQVVILIIHMEL